MLRLRDLETSTFLTAYKGNASGRNGLAILGRDYFLAAQTGKGQALHTWAWHKVEDRNQLKRAVEANYVSNHLFQPPLLAKIKRKSICMNGSRREAANFG